MDKASLKIGNLVHYKLTGKKYLAEIVHIGEKATINVLEEIFHKEETKEIEVPYDRIEPITLNDKWKKELGFRPNTKNLTQYYMKLGSWVFIYEKEIITIYFQIDKDKHAGLQKRKFTVSDFQNLMYFMFGIDVRKKSNIKVVN
jgi:hypothetical protein